MIILNEKCLDQLNSVQATGLSQIYFLCNNLVKLQQHEVKSKNEHIAKVQRVCGNEK